MSYPSWQAMASMAMKQGGGSLTSVLPSPTRWPKSFLVNRLITLIRKHMVHLSEEQTRIGGVVESERKLLLALIGCVAIVGAEFRAKPLSLDSMNATDLSLLKSFYKGSFEPKVALESVIHSDGWLPYDGLVDLSH